MTDNERDEVLQKIHDLEYENAQLRSRIRRINDLRYEVSDLKLDIESLRNEVHELEYRVGELS
jgi:predicted nuclease with TOPRIM domain